MDIQPPFRITVKFENFNLKLIIYFFNFLEKDKTEIKKTEV